MPIFSVWAAAACADVKLNLMVVGVLVPRNWTDGKLPVELLPTVKVTGPQWELRTSCGCMVMMLLPLRNSSGVPSQSPMRQMVATELGSLTAMVLTEVPELAVTVTLPVHTESSFL